MLTKEKYGCIDGKEISLYTLSNKNHMSISISDFGATLINLMVPDNKGNIRDVALGYEKLSGYFTNEEYIGCVVAPNANRICKGICEIDGTVYRLDVNNGENNLHTHHDLAANKQIMDVKEKDNSLIFSTSFKHLQAALPGNRNFSVEYELTDDNELKLTYTFDSDRTTIFNPTNHCYFNLAGHNSGSVFKQVLTINADYYTPVDKTSIPLGEIRPVENSVFDFRKGKEIGQDFDLTDPQLSLTLGYDHNFVINNYNGALNYVASLYDSQSTRKLECYSTQPGVQVYTSNYLNRNDGKENTIYKPHDGICLETQFFPDCVNHKNFASSIIPANTVVSYQTIYKFYWGK